MSGSSVIVRYLGSPLLLMTPLFSRQWRRLVTRMSGWLSASWPMTERSSLRDAASLRSKHIRVNTKHRHSQVFLTVCPSIPINEGKLNNRNTSLYYSLSSEHYNNTIGAFHPQFLFTPTDIFVEWDRRACIDLWWQALVTLKTDTLWRNISADYSTCYEHSVDNWQNK